MKDKSKVLVIDDDLVARKCIDKALRDAYEVVMAVNGTDGIEKAKAAPPDLILLDVEMPGINGFETCDQLKQIDETKHIPVVFLSSRSSLRERMLGYEVGAVDYFVKPFNSDELLARFEVINKYRARHEMVVNKFKNASNVAMVALKGTGELGNILNFVEKIYQIDTYGELAHIIIQTFYAFELSICLVVRSENENFFFSSNGEVKPLEKELIEMLADDHRFHDFGKRTQVNFPRISVLIKNMPIDDMEKYGRYKDLLMPLLTATDAKITILDAHRALYDQTKDLSRSIDIVGKTLDKINESMNKNQTQSEKVLRSMLETIEIGLPKMGLEEDQENFILELLDDSINEVVSLQEEGGENMNSLKLVLSAIESLTNKQTKLVQEVFIKEESVRHRTTDAYDIEDIGIDLF